MAKALQSCQTSRLIFAKQFSTSSYISKLKQKDKDVIAKINEGSDENIKKGDTFIVKNIELSIDPLTNKKSCEKVDTGIVLEATKHITKEYSWTKVIKGDISQIKLLQLVDKQ